MKDNKNLNQELKELSPWLLSMKERGDGFKVPVDYFDRLQDEVLQKVKQPGPVSEPASPGWVEEWLLRLQALFQPRYRLAYALAAAAVVVAAVWGLRNHTPTQPGQQTVALEDLPSEELIDYINLHLDDFAPEELLETQQVSSEGLSLPQLVPLPNESEIEEYLDEIMHDIDVEDIKNIL